VDDPVELLQLACARGHVELATGDLDAARKALTRVEFYVDKLALKSEAMLMRDVEALRAVIEES